MQNESADYKTGAKCSLFGKEASEMSKYELIEFIGALDNIISHLHDSKKDKE